MAGSVNKVILVGNIGKDPEIRSTQGGSQIANMTMATSEGWTDKQSGEKKERTEWHRIVVFNDSLVSIIERFVKKGSKIYVEGSLQTRKWTDQSGVEKYSTEIVLDRFRGVLVLLGDPRGGADRGDEQDRQPAERPAVKPKPAADTWQGGGSTGADLDDDIPFYPEWR